MTRLPCLWIVGWYAERPCRSSWPTSSMSRASAPWPRGVWADTDHATAEIRTRPSTISEWRRSREAMDVSFLDHALRPKRCDLRLRVPEARQHLVGVLPQARRRRLDARAAMGELERGQRHRDRSLDAVDLRVLVEHAASFQLGIGQRLGEAPNPAGRHVARLQILLPLVGGALRDDLVELGGLLLVEPVALLVTRLRGDVGAIERLEQPLVLTAIAGGDHQGRVLGLIELAAGALHPVALGLRLVAGTEVRRDVRAHQHQRYIEHGAVDVLALARALALEERRGDREGAHGAGGVIDHRCAGLDRIHIRRAGHGHHARRGLDELVVRGLLAAGPFLTERRHRAVDEPRVDRA